MSRAYLVECVDGTLYAGSAADLPRRVRRHNGELAGGARYTLPRRPVRLVWASEDMAATLARREEARIKRLSREQKLALIQEASEQRLRAWCARVSDLLAEAKDAGILIEGGRDGLLTLRDPLTYNNVGVLGTFSVSADDAIRLGATRGLFKDGERE